MIPYFKKILCGLFWCFQISPIFCEKILINIDRIVRELDTDAPDTPLCDISAWANQLSNACKCCLFKRVPQIGSGPGQKTIEQIVKECSEKYCTPELINSFKGSAPDLKTALYQLYNTSVVIKKIGKEGIAFDAKENLTEQGAKTLLEKAYKEGKLPNKDFESVTCIKAQDIFAQKKGLATLQLFLINSNCSEKPGSYILKEMYGKYSETKNLAKFFELKQLDDLIWPNHIKNYPSLAIPFAFFQYNDHYLSLAPTASGRELDRFVVDYFLNPTQKNKKDVEQAYFDVGSAISKFHQRFMQNKNDILGLTVQHDDLYHRNIFYDITTRQVTLIDNEGMSSSFENPRIPMKDIVFPILSAGASDLLVPKEIVTKVKPDSWIALVAVPFIKGYISAYPTKDWPLLFNKLVKGIKEYNWGPINLYNKFKNAMDEQFEIVRQFVQDNQSELEGSLEKLKNSLLTIIKFL